MNSAGFLHFIAFCQTAGPRSCLVRSLKFRQIIQGPTVWKDQRIQQLEREESHPRKERAREQTVPKLLSLSVLNVANGPNYYVRTPPIPWNSYQNDISWFKR